MDWLHCVPYIVRSSVVDDAEFGCTVSPDIRLVERIRPSLNAHRETRNCSTRRSNLFSSVSAVRHRRERYAPLLVVWKGMRHEGQSGDITKPQRCAVGEANAVVTK